MRRRRPTSPTTPSTTPGVLGRTLATLLADPTLLRPPRAWVPGILYAGRLTLVVAREKCGKSTLAAFAAAKLTLGAGVWQGRKSACRVVWAGLEEALGDTVRRFKDLAADGDRLHIADRLDGEGGIEALRAEVGHHRADVLIIDSWTAWARRHVSSENDARANALLMQALADWAHQENLCIVVLHHMNKEGESRGSTAITAAADVICTMDAPGGPTSTRRVLDARGRFPAAQLLVDRDETTQEWTLLEGVAAPTRGRLSLSDAEIEEMILLLLSAMGVMTGETLRAEVPAKGMRVSRVLKQLLEQDEIEQVPGRRGYRLATPLAAARPTRRRRAA
jgi:hypothetical protein